MFMDVFTMARTLVRMSVSLYNLNTFLFLHLTIWSRPASPNRLNFADSSLYHHENILSPLLRALSEQDGEPWQDVGPNPKMRVESRHVEYMKKLYKMSFRQRSVTGGTMFNTVRLITPINECLKQSEEIFMQDLSFSLDQVRAKEQPMKSVLLYSFDQPSRVSSLCHLSVQQQDQADPSSLCPSARHTDSFLVDRDDWVRSRTTWVELDVSSFLLPLLQPHRKDIHLVINLTCAAVGSHRVEEEEQGGGSVQLTLRPPSLLLYLNDTSELAFHRRASRAGHRSVGWNSLEPKMNYRPEQWVGHRRHRLRRSPLRSKTAANPTLPELKSIYEFPTSDCALYDFRVTFSQLKLNHWIIYPHWYNPRYCKGTCPRTMGFVYGSPVHTMVQNIIYERLDSSVPRPSCVPSEYKPMNVITEYNGIITYKVYEEMIATRCTCR